MFLGLMQKREGQTINFYGLNPKTCNAHHLSHDTYPTGQRNAIFGMTESTTYPLCQQTRISLQSVILTVLMIKNTIYTNSHYISLGTTIYTQTQIFLPSSLLFIVGVVFLEDSYSQNNGDHEGFCKVLALWAQCSQLQRYCATGNCVKLFGVCLQNKGDGHDAMKSSVSMENLCYEKVENNYSEDDDAKDLPIGINQRKDA